MMQATVNSMHSLTRLYTKYSTDHSSSSMLFEELDKTIFFCSSVLSDFHLHSSAGYHSPTHQQQTGDTAVFVIHSEVLRNAATRST